MRHPLSGHRFRATSLLGLLLAAILLWCPLSAMAAPDPTDSPAPRPAGAPPPAPAPAVSPAPGSAPITPVANPFKDAPGPRQYPTASAIILKDDIQAKVNADGTHELIEYDAIKILDKPGIERFGRTTRSYDAQTQRTQVTLARLWLPDGRMVDVPARQITDTVPRPFVDHPLYKRIHIVNIDYPGLVEGSVIEFRFVHHRKAPWPGKKFWEVSYTQDYEPILDTAFTFSSPAQMPFELSTPGTPNLQPDRDKTVNGVRVMHWQLKDRPVIVRQAAMPPLRDLATQIQVSNFANWDDFAGWQRTQLDQAAVADTAIRAKTASLVNGLDTDDKKVRAIMAWLDKEKASVQGEVGLEELPALPAVDAYAASSMLPQERAVLLITMLRTAGLKAFPALVASADYGDPERGVPSPQQFNRILVVTPGSDGELVWIDPVAPVPGVLGQGWIGRRALVLDGTPARFVQTPITPPQVNREEIIGQSRLDTDSSAEVLMKVREYGANALFWRATLGGSDKVDQRRLFQLLVSDINPTALLKDFYVSPPDPGRKEAFLEVTLDFEMSRGAVLRRNEGYRVPVPIIPQRRLTAYADKPVTERLYPIVLGATAYEERRMQIVIPAGWTVKSIPKSVTVSNAVGSFQVDVRSDDRGVWYFTRLILRKPEISQAEYGDFKAIVDQLGASGEEVIVLTNPRSPAPTVTPPVPAPATPRKKP